MQRGMTRVAAVLVLLSVSPVVTAQSPVPLPVRKVVLYKNGMGYFEHVGEVQGAQDVQIVLPSAQLDDVLKSLTVIDLGRGRVAGVTYESSAPLDRRLAELPVDLLSAPGVANFLNQVRGTQVAIDVPGGPVVGRLMGAEVRAKHVAPEGVVETVEAAVFTPQGELRIVELASAGSLRFPDHELADDLRRYLELLGSALRRDVRRLWIHTVGTGARQLSVSYTSEVPIWKTTYRIVLDDERRPLLQGWAIVDNTTPMDWKQVELSLVAGAPVSFVQNLSQPLYARRPVIPLPEGLQVTPQAHEATLESPTGRAAVAGVARDAPAPDMADERDLFEPLTERPRAAAPAAPSASEAMRRQGPEVARGRALGEQFEYALPAPVTIRRDESALLPIIHTGVDGQKVSLFNEAWGGRRPRLAVWLTNTSGLTLDGGSFTVIDGNVFAGEGLTESIQPRERRLLSYALDLAVQVSTDRGSARERVERVEIVRGVIRLHGKVVEQKVYTIRNEAEKTRTIVVEHPARAGWTLVDTPPAAESTANHHRFSTEVRPKTTAELTVREERARQTTYAIRKVTTEQIDLWIRQRTIDAAIEQALRGIVAQKGAIDELARQMAALEKEAEEIFRDQERVRENLNRLGRVPEEANLRLRYVRQLEDQEDRLAALRAERARLDEQRAAAQRQLDGALEGLAFDRTL